MLTTLIIEMNEEEVCQYFDGKFEIDVEVLLFHHYDDSFCQFHKEVLKVNVLVVGCRISKEDCW